MQIITLYKYTRTDGGITISPIKPEGNYTEMVRIVADDGKAITDGETITTCVDTKHADGWFEIDAPEPDPDNNLVSYDELTQVYKEGVDSIDE